MDIRIAGIEPESVVDGPGLRFVIFAQGCLHKCAECHNPQTHPLNGGKLTTTEELYYQIFSLPLITGVTFSGGEPFLQAAAFAELAALTKRKRLSVLVYTGYTWEALVEHSQFHSDFFDLLNVADYLIDGRYEHTHRSLNIPFRGSKNQRFIDVRASIESGEAVEVAV